ncbi:MAG: shikimate kinase [Nitrospirae bacterium]|nr:shikimate kinase [Candidatus Troglogloeales bacterium]
MKNIVLIGFMGTGKSAVGRRLAKEIFSRFVDTDRLIEEKTGKKVVDIFAEEGERRFRALEAEVIREVMKGERLVVSTGGGAVLNQDNLDLFYQNGTVVWLAARPEIILKRAQRRIGNRPLLRGSNPLLTIEHLLEQRKPYYKRAAFSVDTSDISIDEVVSQIKEKIFGLEDNKSIA